MAKWVYGFGDGKAEGEQGMRNLLGGKGANLAEMSNLGLPVPPGFTITTEVCTYYYANGRTYPPELDGRGRGGARRGRRASPARLRRPGQAAARLGALRRPRLDARHDGHGPQPRPQRRDGRGRAPAPRATRASPTTATAASSPCIPTWCSSIDHGHFEEILESFKERKGYVARHRARRPTTGASLVARYKAIVERELGKPFPQDPAEQLWGAIGAVFASWMNPRAITYRRSTTSRRAGAPPSTSRRWSSATWARPRRPASPSPATPRPARTRSTASS